MLLQEILSSSINKTQKAYKLYDLGYTRRDVANMITNGNYGFAHNIWVKWEALRGSNIIQLPFEFTFSRSFGIELEVYGASRSSIVSCMRAEGIDVQSEDYNHTTRGHWKIVSDSSIQGENGSEVVSPVLRGAEGMEQVKKVCIALQKAGAKVNQSCGFHVHIGINDLSVSNVKDLVSSYINLENDIDAFMPASRRGNFNTYCRNMSSVTGIKSKIKNCSTIGMLSNCFNTRYYKLNLKSYVKYGTVEFRQHAGTTSFSKVKNWVMICARLVEYSKSNGITNNLNYTLNESLQDYISDRAVDLTA